MKYKTNEVRYSARLTLGQYEHEELYCSLSPELDEPVDALELMKEARKISLSNSTMALKKAMLKTEGVK